LFETTLKLMIAIDNDVMWSHLATVHELLERLISCLLKIHVVVKSKDDEVINFLFESQQSFSKLERIF